MFNRILHANDGSEHAFHALALAIEIASQNNSELHMVSVEEISYMPNAIEEIREETGTAARRFHTVLQRARAMAAEQNVTLTTHVIPGHAVRDILALAKELLGEEAKCLVSFVSRGRRPAGERGSVWHAC